MSRQEIKGGLIKCVYHFTSRKSWKDIRNIGFLVPRTDPFEVKSVLRHVSRAAKRIAFQKRNVVCVPANYTRDWVKSGLWSELLTGRRAEIALRITLPTKCSGFVREHKYCSPKEFIDVYGRDLAKLAHHGQLTPNDKKILNKCLLKYYDSTTKLSCYKGGFEVPEVWIHQRIPTASIRASSSKDGRSRRQVVTS